MTTKKRDSKTPLPTGIVVGDLDWPPDHTDRPENYDDSSFELWRTTSFGWVIPTLAISGGGLRARSAEKRTYAVCVGEAATDRRVRRGAQVRVGLGPHVVEKLVVYVRKSRLAALQSYLDLRRDGAVGANETRDRISSRRAQGVRERAAGKYSWRWDV